MGIRIHTVLGYGWESFNLYKLKDYDCEEDLLPKMLEKAKTDGLDGKTFVARIENRGWYEKYKKITSLDSYDFVKSDCLSDEKIGPLIITSPFNADWSRYDDIIDYYLSEKQSNIVKLLTLEDSGLPKPIYPYDGFVNKNTGERVKMSYHDTWEGEKDFIEKHGVKFSDLAAIVPYEIKLFCEIAKFPSENPLDIYTARPMIYTYWS